VPEAVVRPPATASWASDPKTISRLTAEIPPSTRADLSKFRRDRSMAGQRLSVGRVTSPNIAVRWTVNNGDERMHAVPSEITRDEEYVHG
jgi:hypothetical protein